MTNSELASRMWALDGPTSIVERSVLEAGAEGVFSIVTPTYLIEHRDGLVLFDTAFDVRAATDPVEVYGPLAEWMKLGFKPEHRLDEQIKGLGFKLADVSHVVISHLHLDHTGGMRLFPGARFFIGAGELAHALNPVDHQAGFFRAEDIEPARKYRWQEVAEEDHDIFGDGSVTVLTTPGHTPGHLSLVVRLPDRNFVLTGDATHARQRFLDVTPELADVDSATAMQSLRKLRDIEARADATVWVCHDADDWATFGGPRCFE